MPFEKGQSGNPNGRPKAEDLVNPKSVRGSDLRDQEFKMILRKLKPLNRKAINRLHTILDDEGATEATKMKAIAFVLGMYKDLMNDVYGREKGSGVDAEVDEDELKPAPIVSFKVLEGTGTK